MTTRFETVALPHLPAAWNLARLIVRNDQDSEDVLQEATARALRFFDGFRGENPRGWFLKIVRNCAYQFLRNSRRQHLVTEFDERIHTNVDLPAVTPDAVIQRQVLQDAVDALPVEFREVFVLREVERLSYKEIGCIVDIPIGTVMSRLSRARGRLQEAIGPRNEYKSRGMRENPAAR